MKYLSIAAVVALAAGVYGGEVATVQATDCVNCQVPASSSVVTQQQQQYQIPVMATTTTTATTDWQAQPMQAVGQPACNQVAPARATAAPACATQRGQAGCGLRGKLRARKARRQARLRGC